MYNRGGVILYMLHRLLGEERMLAGIREYVERFSFQDDHPTMTDFMALYEGLYPEIAPFFDQFVRGKAIPNPRYAETTKEERDDGGWRVAFEIANQGEGDLDLVVAASKGEEGEFNWREERTLIAVRGTEPVAGEIRCDFEPERIVMDPECTLLLQERRQGRKDL
jgi:hypothetical protein